VGTSVVAMHWTANAAAIVTCGDSFFNVFAVSAPPSIQLSLLKKVSIQQMGNFSLAVSPDSRFVTVGTGVSMGLSVFELLYRQVAHTRAHSHAMLVFIRALGSSTVPGAAVSLKGISEKKDNECMVLKGNKGDSSHPSHSKAIKVALPPALPLDLRSPSLTLSCPSSRRLCWDRISQSQRLRTAA
jgi:hypothetical protein